MDKFFVDFERVGHNIVGEVYRWGGAEGMSLDDELIERLTIRQHFSECCNLCMAGKLAFFSF